MSRFRLVAAVVSLALLAGGVTAVAVARPDREGDATAVPALAVEPFVVTLSAALRGSATVVGSPVVLGSQAMGVNRTVVALELWDGGLLVERSAATARATFRWTPLTTGPHLLHARGISRDGKTARSAPLALDVVALAVKVPPVPVETTPGETGAAVAARLGVAPSRVTLQTRTGSTPLLPSARVPAGAVAQVAVTRSAQPAAADEVVPQPAPPGSGTPLGLPAPAALQLPELSGPTVTLVTDGCDVTLRVTGTDGREATVESGVAGRPGFLSGATREGDGAIALSDLTPGTRVWDVRTSEGVSSPVSATVPAACAATGWQGDSSLVDGILTIPEPTGELYVYLGVDDKPFVRIPRSHDEFLSAPTPRVDISSLLPALDGRKLVLEVWHRVDGDPSQLGTGTLEATDEESLQDVVGEPTAVDLTVYTGNGEARSWTPPEEGEVSFHWTSASPRTSGVMWQVLAAPLTPSNTDVSPFGLVAAGFSMSKGSGTFRIDTTDLPRGGPTADKKPAVPVALGVPDLTKRGTLLPQPLPALDLTTSGASIASDLDSLSPPVVARFWVRVLPLAHVEGQLFESPTGIASSNVVIDLPKPVAPPVTFQVTSLTLTPGAIANPDLRSCIRVTKTPWTGPAPPTYPDGTFVETAAELAARHAKEDKERTAYGVEGAVARAFYPTPGTYCNGDFQPEPCDDVFCYFEEAVGAFVDFVGDAWDFVAAAYNGIISFAVEVFATFNPVCAALSIAKSKAAGTCQDIAGVVAKTAITAVLAAYGLPPSLPTTDTLVSVASGDLSALAVELMTQLGIPCANLKLDAAQSAALVAGGKEAGVDVPTAGGKVDACLYAASFVIGQVRDQVVAATQKQVADQAGLPSFVVPGFELIPEPKGHLQPTVVDLVTVPSRPIGLVEGVLLPPCELATNVTAASGVMAPFANVRGRLHRAPAGGAWVERFVLATPSRPHLDVDSVYQGFSLKGTVSGQCLTGSDRVASGAYGPPLPR